MSHFTVTVRLTKQRLDKHAGSVDEALAEILAPFDENVEQGSPFAEFHDTTDEYREEYETHSVEMVRCPDGAIVFPWDERFRKPGTIGTGSGTHEVPKDAGYELVQVPQKERYATFEAFMSGWAGYKPNEAGRYGYWRNPNKKWDWYTIGGRWRGHFPVKSGTIQVVGRPGVFGNEPAQGCSDIVRRDQLDFDKVASIEAERFEEFRGEYRRFLAGERFRPFDGPREQMLSMGLLRIEQDPAAALREGEVQVGSLWGEEHAHLADTPRASWRDVALALTDEQLARYRVVFNPLRTYAALDDSGWHAPGRMGWFGCSSDEPEGYLAFADAFLEKFIKPVDAEDVLVLVDCHI